MAFTVRIAHDPSCAWCWIGQSQAKRLQAEFGIEIQWVGYELWPEALEWPASTPEAVTNPDKPRTPSRFALALAAEGLNPVSSNRPSNMRTFRTHRALEFARAQGAHDALMDRIYRAHWVHGMNINEPAPLLLLAKGLGFDEAAFESALEDPSWQANVVPFDDEAYASGVYNLPTFWIGDHRYAEQPYAVLREAVAALTGDIEFAVPYRGLSFSTAPVARPTIVLNMVSTLDGKIVSGSRAEPVMDLGSATDHRTMRYLQSLVDGVLVGAGNVRATPGMWYRPELKRFVATTTGNVNPSQRFFSDAPNQAFVVGPQSMSPPEQVQSLRYGETQTDWAQFLHHIRTELGVEVLLLEGGSALNAELFHLDVVDEVFITLAPKVKLGRDTPTIAGGDALPREALRRFELLEHHAVGDEIFVRYRRKSS